MELSYLMENQKSVSSSAAEEVRQVKVGAGRLLKLQVVNVNVAVRFLYVFDSAAGDAGTLLMPPLAIPAAGNLDLEWRFGKQFALGMRVHASSTQATFTASAGADLLLTAVFI